MWNCYGDSATSSVGFGILLILDKKLTAHLIFRLRFVLSDCSMAHLNMGFSGLGNRFSIFRESQFGTPTRFH